MKKKIYRFSHAKTDFYFDTNFSYLQKFTDKKAAVIITDEHVFFNHAAKFKGWNTIVLKSGEEFKSQETVDAITENLIEIEANRNTVLIGVGGGVVTDITGFVGSIYMRGLKFGFVPTTVLAMVDAAIGGKNGIDLGVYKNMVGTITQPSFILYDYSFLQSLPEREYLNGFAEIIKHASIKDAALFKMLEQNDPEKIRQNNKLTDQLIQKNVNIKSKVIQQDEFEKGERRLLNFGHTLGHALENQYHLAHGEAVSIGMSYASRISEKLNGFDGTERVIRLLKKFKLPTEAVFDKQKVFNAIKMDKKRQKKDINYVLLEKIGKGIIRSVPLKRIEKLIEEF